MALCFLCSDSALVMAGAKGPSGALDAFLLRLHPKARSVLLSEDNFGRMNKIAERAAPNVLHAFRSIARNPSLDTHLDQIVRDVYTLYDVEGIATLLQILASRSASQGMLNELEVGAYLRRKRRLTAVSVELNGRIVDGLDARSTPPLIYEFKHAAEGAAASANPEGVLPDELTRLSRTVRRLLTSGFEQHAGLHDEHPLEIIIGGTDVLGLSLANANLSLKLGELSDKRNAPSYVSQFFNHQLTRFWASE